MKASRRRVNRGASTAILRLKQISAAFVDRLVVRLQPPELEEVLSAASDGEKLLCALNQPSALGLFPPDPLLPAQLRGLRAREQLLAAEGGPLNAVQVGSLLHISRQAVDKRRIARKLLTIEAGKRFLYPAWQFSEEEILPGLEATLKILEDHPPLAQFRFFLSGNHRLGGDRPLDRLRQGETEPVLRAARVFGEQGAA